jgi:hypothetical protein
MPLPKNNLSKLISDDSNLARWYLVSEGYYMNVIVHLLDPVQRQEVERAGDLEHSQAPLCLVHRPEHKSHLSAGSQYLFFRAWIFKELLHN